MTTGQNTIGLPEIMNYTKQEYAAGLQNWDIKQGQNGVIYFANNEGLLRFDGKYWRLYPLPNKTIVRSLAISKNNKIYTGGQGELGYFTPGPNSELYFKSLIPLIPEKDRVFSDVWSISIHNEDVFFQTSKKIFRISNDKASVFDAPSEWTYMGMCNERLYAHDSKNGLFYFDNTVWRPLPLENRFPANDPVTGMIPLSDSNIFITTLKSGIFILNNHNRLSPWSTPTLSAIIKDRIYKATALADNKIALATSNGGVHIINKEGEQVQQFSKAAGLQNNNVLAIFPDKDNNIWAGLDNGISFIAFNSAIKRIVPDEQEGAGYSAIIFNNHLYVGTSGGLFKAPLQPIADYSFLKGIFSRVPNTSGQVWNLTEINGHLLMGHHEGAFAIDNNGAHNIYPGEGFWNFIPMRSIFPTPGIIAGNYNGLQLFSYDNNRFIPTQHVPGFNESSRFVAIDNKGAIWVSHPYHGVYCIRQQPDQTYHIQSYTVKDGLPSALNNHVYLLKNNIVVATEKGIYAYDEKKNIFLPDTYYKNILGEQSIRYVKEDKNGNTWFVHEKSVGVIDISGKGPKLIYLQELTNKILSGFEFIYPIDQNNILISSEKGLFHINYEKYKKNIPQLKVLIDEVRIINKKDSLLYGGYAGSIHAIHNIAHQWHTIRFQFSSPAYEQEEYLEYSFHLKGLEESWSEWSKKTEKEYTNLAPGAYTFEIKVRSSPGNESPVSAYTFNILPPWYQTLWAYIAYVFLFIVLLYLLYQRQQKKFLQQQLQHEEEQKKIQYLHQLEIDKAENELVALRNEKLQAEIEFKNSELTTSAMHLAQKGELLSKLKTGLNQIMKTLQNEDAIAEVKKMIKVLGEDERTDEDWKAFIQHFDRVHNDFVSRLKEKHPAVTANELKLCAYLRMNLSTKEIARLMNISVRGTEISRYRLRKKLGIPSEVNLFNYLMEI